MFLDSYVKEIRNLELALQEAFDRLKKGGDGEALHDLRIAVRRIRSLIAPLRTLPENRPLRETAAAVGRLTTPTRDLEVLAVELQEQRHPILAKRRRDRLQQDYQQIIASAELQLLFDALRQWPEAFQQSELGSNSKGLKRTIRLAVEKQVSKLDKAIDDPAYDRHQLRILVKRTRYLTDAFPSLSPLSADATKTLKKVQAALGAWHDHFQWLLRSQQEKDLKVVQQRWSQAAAEELMAAEKRLRKLARLLPDGDRKKASRRKSPKRKR